MAVIYENLEDGLMRAYSDSGVKIHGGFPEADYDITYFPKATNRTYVETDIPVDKPIKEYLNDGPTQYSKLKILMAAQEHDIIEPLVQFLNSDLTIKMIWDASNVIEDNELLANYMPYLETALGKTEKEIRAFLDSYCKVD